MVVKDGHVKGPCRATVLSGTAVRVCTQAHVTPVTNKHTGSDAMTLQSKKELTNSSKKEGNNNAKN